MLLVCHNASVHKVDEIKKLMEQYWIILRFLPRRHLAVDLKRWKEEQERIKGEAVLNNRPHPTITPWLLEKTKIAIRQFFIDTGITPFEDGRWTQYLRELFTNHRKTSTSDKILSNVLKLQDKKCISAYLFSNGLDDQDPSQWGDAEVSHLVVPEADYPSGSEEEEGEEEEEEEHQASPPIHDTPRKKSRR
jgi:hypothetical protein